MTNSRTRRYGMVALILASAACSDSGGSTTPPPMPTLGAQLDRDGRPGVSALVVGTFDAAGRAAARDAYNANENPTTWSTHSATIQQALAWWDGVDAVCGNALLASPTGPRYAPLADALADDRLYLNSNSTTCSSYFAVEAAALVGAVNTDCGGRAPTMDVVDATYSMFVTGALTGVSDGVAAPSGIASPTFPYLTAPH